MSDRHAVWATYRFAPERLTVVNEKIAVANRKAARNGLGTPFWSVVTDSGTGYQWVSGLKIEKPWVEVEIRGEAPSLEGWQFAAVVEWDPFAGPLVKAHPTFQDGQFLPVPVDKACAHCGTARDRKDTFLVAGPDGEIKQVGRQCLAVYTGIGVGWITSGEELTGLEGELTGFGRGLTTLHTDSMLTIAVAVVDALGYASTQALIGTRQRVAYCWNPPLPADKRGQEIYAETLEALAKRSRSDEAVATEVAAIWAWAGTLKNADNNYLLNIAGIVTADWVTDKNLGFAVSAVTAWRREQGRIQERKARAAAAPPKAPVPFTGRNVIEGTIRTLRVVESDYGSVVKVRVVSDAGWALWGSLPRAIDDALVGDRIRFTAAVEVSADDPSFGFYSRPTKASVVARGEEGEAA